MKAEVIYGPPGTGKTTTLLDMMAAGGIEKDRIGFVSFTRAAANEASTRLGLINSKTIRTIHSFAYSIVGAIKEQMIDASKLKAFGRTYGYEFTGGVVDGVTQGLSKGDEMLALHSLAMARMMHPMEVFESTHPDFTPAEFEHFVKAYKIYRDAYGFMDFNDLILRSLERNIDLKVDVLFVDEAQDLSPLQWAFIDNASQKVKRLVIAGDDDQCIYAWAGAHSQGMSKYHSANNISILSQSYRVPRLVHSLAQSVILNIDYRVTKEYAARPDPGEINYHYDIDQVDISAEDKGSTLVLYRNHTSRREIENWLMSNAIRFKSTHQFGSPFTDQYANAVRAYQQMEKGESISTTQLQAMVRVTCSQYKERVEKRDYNLMKRLSWGGLFNIPGKNSEYLRQVDLSAKPSCILSTIHSAKGMEADRVILYNSMGQRTWEGFSDDEHRVWYVAVTRTRDKLDIVNGDNPYTLE